MDTLYTPWRRAYITANKGSGVTSSAATATGCVFCDAQHAADEDALIIARSHSVFAILNLFPYNSGHLMIIPYQHVGSPEELPADTLLDVMQTANRAFAVLKEAYHPHAFNFGANIGSAAGAGIAGHLHYHIVPRWNGDANFMTTVGSTRVIPDTLENMQRELKTLWQAHYPDTGTVKD